MAFPRTPEEKGLGHLYAHSMSSIPPARPRPYSQALDDVLKKDFPSAPTFEERLDLLLSEYKRNYRVRPQRDLSTGSSSAASNTGSRSKSSPRANPTSIQLNSVPLLYHINGSTPIRPFKSDQNEKKRKRRNYTDEEKVEVARIRKVGACGPCNKSHKKCTHVDVKGFGPGSCPEEACILENVGANIDFSNQGYDLVTPEDHSILDHVPRRTLDTRNQPPKAGHPVGDTNMNLGHGSLASDFLTFDFDFTPISNSLSFQDQGVPAKGPQGGPQEDYLMNPPMVWSSGTLSTHPQSSSGPHPQSTFPNDDLAQPWNLSVGGPT